MPYLKSTYEYRIIKAHNWQNYKQIFWKTKYVPTTKFIGRKGLMWLFPKIISTISMGMLDYGQFREKFIFVSIPVWLRFEPKILSQICDT